MSEVHASSAQWNHGTVPALSNSSHTCLLSALAQRRQIICRLWLHRKNSRFPLPRPTLLVFHGGNFHFLMLEVSARACSEMLLSHEEAYPTSPLSLTINGFQLVTGRGAVGRGRDRWMWVWKLMPQGCWRAERGGGGDDMRCNLFFRLGQHRAKVPPSAHPRCSHSQTSPTTA